MLDENDVGGSDTTTAMGGDEAYGTDQVVVVETEADDVAETIAASDDAADVDDVDDTVTGDSECNCKSCPMAQCRALVWHGAAQCAVAEMCEEHHGWHAGMHSLCCLLHCWENASSQTNAPKIEPHVN